MNRQLTVQESRHRLARAICHGGRGPFSPLKDRNINFLGRYLFNIRASGTGQGLRPFRDPAAVEDNED
jgi:hypothetical protein